MNIKITKFIKKTINWLFIKENLIKIILWLLIFILLALLTNNLRINVNIYGRINLLHGGGYGGDTIKIHHYPIDVDVDHGDIDVDLGNQPGGVLSSPGLDIKLHKR